MTHSELEVVETSISAKCIFVTRSLWECLGVVGPESQGGQIPELTGPMEGLQVHLGAPGKAGNKHGSTVKKPACTLNGRRAVWAK